MNYLQKGKKPKVCQFKLINNGKIRHNHLPTSLAEAMTI